MNISVEEKNLILEMYGLKGVLVEDISSSQGMMDLVKRFKECAKKGEKTTYKNLVKLSGGITVSLFGLFLIFIGVTGEILSMGLSTFVSGLSVKAGIGAEIASLKMLYDTNYDMLKPELEHLKRCMGI